MDVILLQRAGEVKVLCESGCKSELTICEEWAGKVWIISATVVSKHRLESSTPLTLAKRQTKITKFPLADAQLRQKSVYGLDSWWQVLFPEVK